MTLRHVQEKFSNAFSFPVLCHDDEIEIEWDLLLAIAEPLVSRRHRPVDVSLIHENRRRLVRQVTQELDIVEEEGITFTVDGKPILTRGSFIAEGSYGKVYRFALGDGHVAVKIQDLSLLARYDATKKHLLLHESLLEPVSLAILGSELSPELQSYFPKFYGSYIFRYQQGLAMLLVEEFIEGETVDKLTYEELTDVDYYERKDDMSSLLYESEEPKIVQLDNASPNIIVTSEGEIVFVDHGYTVLEKVPGWSSDRVRQIGLFTRG